ncbi:MAG TPA: serine/threonine-protein kinase [Candidatus Hydrogenedentes bacterium]|nr:serine/threonine-protein kinase [Candidatus Hydrogenedentota bacterium]
MPEDIYTPDRPKLYHYKLDRILGQGGTGRVYRGIDTKRGQVVAVKLFHENFFRNRLHLRDLVRGVKRFRTFKHDNVVRIFDFIDGPEGRCMIMEYVDGPNLKWYLTNRPWNLQERLIVVAQMCNGLQYLHDNGCIHHDFKPANVLFTRKGVVKVADYSLYGTSVFLEFLDGGAVEQVTPMFVAPEFLRKERVTARSDQYALGITMYMMFTDRLPYPVDNLQQLYQCHLRVVPMHPHEANPRCPQELGDIIMRLLDKQATNRFRDCDELRIVLSDIGRSRI